MSMKLITAVTGDAMVEDRTMKYTQGARAGMQFHPNREYLSATPPASSVELLMDGRRVHLKESSVMHIKGDRAWWSRHSEQLGRDIRLFMGRWWAKVDRSEQWHNSCGNSTIGVRG
jgi:hypothetical protein